MSEGKRIFEQLKDRLFGTKSHELLTFCFFLYFLMKIILKISKSYRKLLENYFF